MKTTISLLFIFFTNLSSLSDTSSVKFFPLSVGNIYIYNYSQSSWQGNSSGTIKARVLMDTVITGRKYFKFSDLPRFDNAYWYRTDTLTGSVLRYNPSNACPYYISESFIDSLAANQGDMMKDCGNNFQYASYTCSNIDTLILFNTPTINKSFYYQYSVGSYTGHTYTIYAKNFGLQAYTTSSGGVFGGSTSYILKGCVINGLVYGDTTIPRPARNYFPLSVGNRYTYLNNWSSLTDAGQSLQTSRITRDTVAYGKRYYWAVNFPFFNNIWIRIDTYTGSLYSLDKTNSCSFYNREKIIDSLISGLNDSTKNCLAPNSRSKCTDTSYIYLFGNLNQKKKFEVNCSELPTINCALDRSYVEAIGVYSYNITSNGSGGNASWLLKGALISGVLLGDTSTVIGISTISTEIPEDYSLSQNYPNPFNPQTKIVYAVIQNNKTRASNIKIIVYDISGSEILTLVNEKQTAGTYSVEFSGNTYASGLYFYSLIVDGVNVSTKKMMLLK